MSEKKSQTPPTETTEDSETEKLSIRQRFTTKFPRSTKVAAAVVGVGAVVVAVGAVKNAQDRKHLDSAADDLGEALDILEQHVNTTD